MKTHSFCLCALLSLRPFVLASFRRFAVSSFGCFVIGAILLANATAATITPVGVIGNSGEQGDSILRLGLDHRERRSYNPIGCGVVLDRFGSLWTRITETTVQNLAADGRQLGRFTAPSSCNKFDTLTSLGDTLMLLAAGELHTLPVTAPSGASFQGTGVRLRALSISAYKGRLAGLTPEGTLVWIDAKGATTETGAVVPDGLTVEVSLAGDIFIGCYDQETRLQRLRKITNGKEIIDSTWPRVGWMYARDPRNLAPAAFMKSDGDGGYFFGGGGFVAHLDGDFVPTPGTLLGGQNDHVIGGSGDWHPQLSVARGIVKYGEGDLYIVCSVWGQLFFAQWPNPHSPMKLIAWFGAVPECSTLAIDANGTVFADHNVYAWNDTPDSFPEQGPTMNRRLSPILTLGDRGHLGLFLWAHGAGSWAVVLQYGDRLMKRHWMDGSKLTKNEWERYSRKSKEDVMPAVVLPDSDERNKNGHVLMCMADVEKARMIQLYPDGNVKQFLGFVSLVFTSPSENMTSLVVKDPTTLLAAVDGEIVELSYANETWREARRWKAWGNSPSDTFGDTLYLAFDGGNLLVSDTDKHRLLLFKDGARGVPLATFGGKPGTLLTAMDTPTLVSMSGNRAVVYDSGNQRILKLHIAP